MKKLKKFIALATLAAMFASSTGLQAQEEECAIDTGGCGYNESRESPCLAPAIALGVIAIVAIIAVAVQNRSNHGHSHAHF
jgi:hypothetical protein